MYSGVFSGKKDELVDLIVDQYFFTGLLTDRSITSIRKIRDRLEGSVSFVVRDKNGRIAATASLKNSEVVCLCSNHPAGSMYVFLELARYCLRNNIDRIEATVHPTRQSVYESMGAKLIGYVENYELVGLPGVIFEFNFSELRKTHPAWIKRFPLQE